MIFLNEKSLGSMLFYNSTNLEFGRKHSNELVIIIHGWLSGAVHTNKLAKDIREKLGYTTYRLDLSLTFGSMEGALAECAKQLEKINFGKDFAKVHFIGHSMGGLVAKIVLNRWDFPNIGKLVTLGTPFNGSKVLEKANEVTTLLAHTFFWQHRDEIIKDAKKKLVKNTKLKVGAIAGDKMYTIDEVMTRADFDLRTKLLGNKPNDGSVTVESALGLPEVTDKLIVHKNHQELIYDTPLKEIYRFLQLGRFR